MDGPKERPGARGEVRRHRGRSRRRALERTVCADPASGTTQTPRPSRRERETPGDRTHPVPNIDLPTSTNRLFVGDWRLETHGLIAARRSQPTGYYSHPVRRPARAGMLPRAVLGICPTPVSRGLADRSRNHFDLSEAWRPRRSRRRALGLDAGIGRVHTRTTTAPPTPSRPAVERPVQPGRRGQARPQMAETIGEPPAEACRPRRRQQPILSADR